MEIKKYGLREILCLDDSPKKLSASFAVGIFITMSPFYGFHTLIAIVVIFLFPLNYVAVFIGSAVNLPWITPFIYFFCYFIGSKLWLLFPFLDSFDPFNLDQFKDFFNSWLHFKTLFHPDNFLRIFLPTLLGSFVIGSIAAWGSYFGLLYILTNNLKRNPGQCSENK